MDVNDSSIDVGKDGALPNIARNVRILLVDYDTNSLLSHASQFEQQSYKVTMAKAADVALSLLKAQPNYYNIVIIDLHMPEMGIYEFVNELRCQHINIPVIVMAENITKDSAEEALASGVCYVVSKPITNSEIAILWQHVYRVARENFSDLKTQFVNQQECVGPVMSTALPATPMGIFLRATPMGIFLEGQTVGSQPKPLFRMINEPDSTIPQVSSHLQKTVIPDMHPTSPMSIFLPGQTSGTANFDSAAARGVSQISGPQSLLKPPNFMGYTIDDVNEMLDALNNSGNDTVNAVITNTDFQIPKGSGEVQIGPSYGQEIPASNHAILASGYLSNGLEGLEAPNSKPACATDDVLLSIDHLISGFQAEKELAGATGDVILSCIHSQNGLQALNQESSPDIGMGMYGSRNAIGRTCDNLGEGTSGN